MRKKAILSLDKFAKNSNLSTNQLATVKGGRKKMSSSKSVFNDSSNDDYTLGG